MEKRKIVAVAYPVGRVGSSAMMGLLHLADLHVGSDRRLFEPAPMNPKGFFELPEQERFLRETWPVIYPHASIPPAPLMVDRIARERAPAYRRLLDDALGGRYPAAVKSPWCLTLPFLREMADEFDVRVLYMERVREDQIASLLRVWRDAGDPARRHASRDFVAEYVDRWRAFGDGCLKGGGLPHMRVSFDALVADPVPVMNGIASFLDIEPPPEDRIREWVDPAIVNRETLTPKAGERTSGESAGAAPSGPTLSVVVNTRNAEAALDGCLASAAPVADEIVVVDMESDDGTVHIARRYTDKIFTHPRVGYVEPARNFALDRATGDWILLLDADERLSPELADGVRDVIAGDEGTALFFVPRRNLFAGRWLEGSGFGPDRETQPRLFRRGRVRWTDRIHGAPEVDGEARPLPLPPEACLRHRWAETISDLAERLNRYTDIEAAALRDEGERWSLDRMLESARLEVENRYDPKKDGMHSLVVAGAMAYYRFLSWAKLWEMESRAEVPLPPDARTLFRAFGGVLSSPPPAESFEEESVRLFTEGDAAGAVLAMTRAIEAAPDRVDLLRVRANLHFASGDAEACARDLERAIDGDPSYAPAFIDLATLLLGTGKGAEAERTVRRALDRDPENAEALDLLATIYRETGHPAEAAALYEARAAADLQDTASLLAAGLCHYESGRIHESRRAYERALQRDPENEIALDNLRVLAGEEGGGGRR